MIRNVGIVTGGTRGIGLGIAERLAANRHDLLLAYLEDDESAAETQDLLERRYGTRVVTHKGDLAQNHTRHALFRKYDGVFGTHRLNVMVHNAGGYVMESTRGFGDGSYLENATDVQQRLTYNQNLYGNAYIDLCEQSLVRMHGGFGGSLVGISAPCGVTRRPNTAYDVEGTGKCIMEYSSRLIALRCANRRVNCNVVVPGLTRTSSWTRSADRRGLGAMALMHRVSNKVAPMGSIHPNRVGEVVNFLVSPQGRIITGVTLPVDGGSHLIA